MGRVRHWACLSFQLTLCVSPEQAKGVLTGPQMAPVLGLSKEWPKSQESAFLKNWASRLLQLGLCSLFHLSSLYFL